MRVIRDDIYLFSVARSCPGKIVACRAADGDGAVGKNISDVLSLDRGDVEYARSQRDLEEYRSVCLSCYPDGRHKVVAFFDFMSYSSSLCLAVVFDAEPDAAARALASLGGRNAELSPSLTRLLRDGESLSVVAHEAYTYISYVYGCVAPLGSLRASAIPENPEALRRYVDHIADLIGIEIDYFTERSFDGAEDERSVFSGGFLLATLLAASILARRYSIDRRLEIAAVQGKNMLLMELSFAYDGDVNDESFRFLSEVASSYGIHLDVRKRDGKYGITLMPTYADVGLAGVKERDCLPLYSLLREWEE